MGLSPDPRVACDVGGGGGDDNLISSGRGMSEYAEGAGGLQSSLFVACFVSAIEQKTIYIHTYIN